MHKRKAGPRDPLHLWPSQIRMHKLEQEIKTLKLAVPKLFDVSLTIIGKMFSQQSSKPVHKLLSSPDEA